MQLKLKQNTEKRQSKLTFSVWGLCVVPKDVFRDGRV